MDDEFVRIANCMQTECQNLYTVTRAHDHPPDLPAPPGCIAA
jgi:hypothetical protein